MDILTNLRTSLIKPHVMFLTFYSSSFLPSQACSIFTDWKQKH